MEKGVVVKGSGLICAIGNDKNSCFNSLMNAQSGITRCELLHTIHKGDFPVGEIKLTNNDLHDYLQIAEEEANKYPRTTLLAIIAVREAIEEAGIDVLDNKRTGLVVGTSVGGMTETELKYKKHEDQSYFKTHPCGDVSEKVAKYFGINDYYTTINTACSSAANAIMHGIRLLQLDKLDRVIVGGADALSVYTLNGFNSLMILSNEATRPFDANRKGLNLGEGAAFLVLEKENKTLIYCGSNQLSFRVLSSANSNDAYHQTASSPDGNGAYNAMKLALKKANLLPQDIHYINAHGTGTLNNDLTEGIAFKRLFANKVPLFSSTKAFTGHTLGAAAAIEAVISLISLKNNLIFPNLNFSTPIEQLNLKPVTEVMPKELSIVMSNSFGFAGNDSSVIFAKMMINNGKQK